MIHLITLAFMCFAWIVKGDELIMVHARGMGQEFGLGQVLNERYSGDGSNLISYNYTQKEIYVRSDDYNRTLMSAMSNLAGLYQNSTSQVQVPGWPAAFWQPIPVHTISLDTDIIVSDDVPCPRADQIMTDTVMQSDDYISAVKSFQPLLDYLTSVCGYTLTLDNIGDNAFDPLHGELIHHDEGHTWPNYINGSIYEQIVEANKVAWYFSYNNPTLARLRGGNMLGDMVKRMQQKRTSLSNPNETSLNWVRELKFYMYSSHDTVLKAFMTTLGAQNDTDGQPGYSSCALLELWTTNEGEFYVKTYYRQNTSYEFVEIQVDGCPMIQSNQYCSLDTFYNRSYNFIPQNWTQECMIDNTPSIASITLLQYYCTTFLTVFALLLNKLLL